MMDQSKLYVLTTSITIAVKIDTGFLGSQSFLDLILSQDQKSALPALFLGVISLFISWLLRPLVDWRQLSDALLAASR